MSYISYAFFSAFFAALTSILAKKGMKGINSNLATALRTGVILIFSIVIVFITTDISAQMSQITSRTIIFLTLSGITTGVSWLCYFHALKIGNVNIVVPIDKSSIVFTILLSTIILNENFSILKAICTFIIALGTYLMIERQRSKVSKKRKMSILFAFSGAIAAALTSILAKIGISGISSDTANCFRTMIVLLMAWLIVFFNKDYKSIKQISSKSFIYIILSGIVTGASWLCYYRALALGPTSHVVAIDKLSILFTVILSFFIFREKLSLKSFSGLVLIVTGTLLLLIC